MDYLGQNGDKGQVMQIGLEGGDGSLVLELPRSRYMVVNGFSGFRNLLSIMAHALSPTARQSQRRWIEALEAELGEPVRACSTSKNGAERTRFRSASERSECAGIAHAVETPFERNEYVVESVCKRERERGGWCG